MIDIQFVNNWLSEFTDKLKNKFGARLVFAANHGSWARGETHPGSDIDILVILDDVSEDDLKTFRCIIGDMSDGGVNTSGLLMSVAELQQAPAGDLVQFFYGRNVLHGSLEGIVELPDSTELLTDVWLKANMNLHHARHYLLFPHDLPKVVHRLLYPFKDCFYALQFWFLATEGKYITRKDDMLPMLDNDTDKQAVITARDWYKSADDRTARPEYYINLLERWSRGMLRKLEGSSGL